MLVGAPFQLWHPKMSPGIAKCPLGFKTTQLKTTELNFITTLVIYSINIYWLPDLSFCFSYRLREDTVPAPKKPRTWNRDTIIGAQQGTLTTESSVSSGLIAILAIYRVCPESWGVCGDLWVACLGLGSEDRNGEERGKSISWVTENIFAVAQSRIGRSEFEGSQWNKGEREFFRSLQKTVTLNVTGCQWKEK